jgi:hypothetical protein
MANEAVSADQSALSAGAAAITTPATTVQEGTPLKAGEAGAGGVATPVAGATTPTTEKPGEATVKEGTKSAMQAGVEEKKEPTAEEKAAADKTAKDAATATPDPYKEVKAPEGVTLDTPTWKAVTPIFAKHDIKPEVVQEIINEFGKAASAQVAAANQEYVEAQRTSRAECEKLFKKDDFVNATRGVTTMFSDPVLVKFMIEQLGNHPDFIRGMAKIGQATREDGTPGTQEGTKAEIKTAEQQFAKSAGWVK